MVQLVARDDEQGRGLASLRAVGRVVVVGPGGIGKTSLARELAASLSDERLVVEADRVARTRAIESLVVDLVGGPRPGDDAADVLASRTGRRKLVLVLDGADGIVDQVLALATAVPAGPDGPWVVVTSRVQPGPTNWPILRLGPLPADGSDSPAAALFRERFAAAGGDLELLAAAPEQHQRMVGETAGVPLAIEVAAARAAVLGFHDLDPAAAVAGTRDVVADSLARSLDALPDDAVALFDALGTTSGRFPVTLAAALVDHPRSRVEGMLATLARHSLVQVTPDGFAMLPPIHRQAWRRLDVQRGRVVARHRDWCLDRARVPGTEAEARSLVALDLDLWLAVERALGTEDVAAACAMVEALDDAYRMTGQHRRRVELITATLDRLPGEARFRRDRAGLLRWLALAHDDTDGPSAAVGWLDRATAALGEIAEDDPLSMAIRRNRASFRAVAGDPAGAVDVLLEVADRSASTGDLDAELHARRFAANALLELGRLDEAGTQAGLVVNRAGPTRPALRQLGLDSRAMIALELGDRAGCEAIGRRLATTPTDGSRRLDGEYLMLVADPAVHADRPAWSTPGPDRRDDVTATGILAELGRATRLLVTGDPTRALAVATDVAVTAEGWEVVWAMLDALLLAGDAADLSGDAVQAAACHRHALVVAAQRGYVLRVADALDGLARARAGPDPRRAAATAAVLRRNCGAVARPRPWLPRPDPAIVRGGTAPAPAWIVAGQLSADGVAHFASPQATPHGPLDMLSPAERRVVALVVDGCTNREIGERLHIGRRTVETHLLHAFQKLDVSNRTQLAIVIATAGPD